MTGSHVSLISFSQSRYVWQEGERVWEEECADLRGWEGVKKITSTAEKVQKSSKKTQIKRAFKRFFESHR